MQWWNDLSTQERRALILGGGLTALLLGYLMLWQPLMTAVAKERRTLTSQESTLAWMELAALDAQVLRKSLRSQTAASGGSLLGIIEKTGDAHGIRGYIQRIEPTGDREAQIWMDQVAFDRLIQWLETLQNNHGVVVKTLSVGREQTAGIVNVRLVLMRVTS